MSKPLENMTYSELLKVIKSLESEKQQLEFDNLQLETKAQQLESKNQHLQFRIDQLNRMIFGAKRERYISSEPVPGQLALPFEVEEKSAEPIKIEEITYTREKKPRKNHPGRTPLPDHLPVEEIVIEPEEDTTGLKCIGKEVTDQLEFTPAKLYIKRYIRPRYIKPEDDQKLNYKGIIEYFGQSEPPVSG